MNKADKEGSPAQSPFVGLSIQVCSSPECQVLRPAPCRDVRHRRGISPLVWAQSDWSEGAFYWCSQRNCFT